MISMLSYPCSGSHFVRYIIEFLTKRATLGCRDNRKIDIEICRRGGVNLLSQVDISSPIAEKWHGHENARVENNIGNKLMIILRYPIEAFISHYKELIKESVVQYQDVVEKDNKWIRRNLECYVKCQKPKCIVVYEDLVFSNPTLSVKKIASFFDVPNKKVDLFLQDFDKYREDSKGSLVRPGKSDTPNYYRSKLSESDLALMCSLMSDTLKHPIITKIYGEIK